VIDSQGRVVASKFDEHEVISAAGLDYFENGRKATFLQPVFKSPITEQFTMVIASPIRDQLQQYVGVLAARLNLKRFYRLINDTTGLGTTGETVVGKKLDEFVVFMAPTRHDEDAAIKRKVRIGSQNSHALQEAARGQSGAGIEDDYRGVKTFMAWQNVPSLEWGLVTKIDHSEATSWVSEVRSQVLLLMVGILLLCVFASSIASRALVQPLRELKLAADRISRGDFNVQIQVRSRDEIGELGDSFERMVAAIKFFREYSRRAEDELEDTESVKPNSGS
jgi:nitrogen fixation/metabolism regulation signal transduction histidine kinase